MGGVLFKNLTFLQIVKKFPVLFDSRKSITALTSYIPFPILNQIRQVHAPNDLLNTQVRIILAPTLSSYKWPLSLSKTLCELLVYHIRSTRAILFLDLILYIWWWTQTTKVLILQPLAVSCYLVHLTPKYLHHYPILKHTQPTGKNKIKNTDKSFATQSKGRSTAVSWPASRYLTTILPHSFHSHDYLTDSKQYGMHFGTFLHVVYQVRGRENLSYIFSVLSSLKWTHKTSETAMLFLCLRTCVLAHMSISVSQSPNLNFCYTRPVFTTLGIHTTTLQKVSTLNNNIMAAVWTFSLTHLLI